MTVARSGEGGGVGDLRARAFRIQNFKNVDDSGWIELDRITALVGRNESGKSALLQGLHKFNPSTELPYVPQREFPRDRYQREYDPDIDIPISSVRFSIEGELAKEIAPLVTTGDAPTTVTFTRLYSGALEYELEPSVVTPPITKEQVEESLEELAAMVRRLTPPGGEDEGKFSSARGDLQTWITDTRKSLPAGDLRNDAGRKALAAVEKGVEAHANQWTADAVEAFLPKIKAFVAEAETVDLEERISDMCETKLPVFIYFEDYGILDSAVYLPRFLADLTRIPEDSKVRTINAMFRHVKLSAEEVNELGTDPFAQLKVDGKAPTPAQVKKEQERRDHRAIKLNSASLDITQRFSEWWHQRRHAIRYHADAEYFRIWIADDRRPGVEIELESRSKGFQWFFSFYLVFLVESDLEHRDAILLLDEPGIHLHMTAQAELLDFFEELAAKNQLIYTTHAASLIDGRRLTRIRAVRETANGRSEVSTSIFPSGDRETYMPIQAALGYDLAQTLFQGRRGAILEGAADLLHINAMDLLLKANGRAGISPDLMLVPSEGTKFIGVLASIYIGQGVRPVVVLDDDDAGRTKAAGLTKELYRDDTDSILFVSQAVPGAAEIEDVVGEALMIKATSEVLGAPVTLNAVDRAAKTGVVDAITAWAKRTGTKLPVTWKFDVAYRVLKSRVAGDTTADSAQLDRAQALLTEIDKRAKK